MGPRGLNKFLRCENPKGINMLNLRELSGKKIVIDVSIYLYRFNINDELFENFYNMLINFKRYNIIPLFVFDGKPPLEKQETIEQRRQERREAEKKYNEIIETNNIDNYSKYSIEALKRKKTIISIKNKVELKQMFDFYGVMYIDAPSEADVLCAYYVKTNQAWACLSDDMDLFMYGCPRILRYLSLINMTVVYYNLNDILSHFNISMKNFVNICIMSGTDYNDQINKIDRLFYNHKQMIIKNMHSDIIQEVFEKNLITILGIDKYTGIIETYTCHENFDNYDVTIKYNKQNLFELQKFLNKFNFIFI